MESRLKIWLQYHHATHVLGQENPYQAQHNEESQSPHPPELSTPYAGPTKATFALS
jgi:hypothetical protein